MEQENDKILFDKIINGDKKAFDTLFRKFYAKLCRFAHLINKDQSAAEEVVQDVFINLWNKREKIQITSSVNSYLYMSVRNTCLNHLKRDKVRQMYETDQESMYEEDDENIYEDADLKVALEAGIKTLPSKCQTIFMLSRYEGLTYDEIAEYMDLSNKTVENQMGIAYKKLRQFLTPHLKRLVATVLIYWSFIDWIINI